MPIFTLLTSAEASDDLIQQSGIRDDLHFGAPNELLRPFGVERSYKGFYHIIDPYPIRYTWDATNLVFKEIPVWIEDNTDINKGKGLVLNPVWQDPTPMTGAEFELSHIFSTSVYKSLVPTPITNPASGWQFAPVNYPRDWPTMNIIDRVNNPDGTIIYHRGIFEDASKPIIPQHGYSILHRRIDPALNATIPA